MKDPLKPLSRLDFKHILEARGYRQIELARRGGVSQSGVSRFLAGKRHDFQTAIRIVRAAGLPDIFAARTCLPEAIAAGLEVAPSRRAA